MNKLIILITTIFLLSFVIVLAKITVAPIEDSVSVTSIRNISYLPQNWWEKETEMQNGKLSFINKDWFNQAKNLLPNEIIYLNFDNNGNPHILVRKEGDMIVEVVDDDKDMKAGDKDGDKDSDAYLVDYYEDGLVDRMVDYIDNDGDNRPDEMDIRYYYDGGELRYAWFAEDLDKDGKMWGLNSRYEYDGNFYNSDARGNNMVYLNKYNLETNSWVPLSEDPFAFYDLDADGESEAAIRMAVTPTNYDPNKDGWDYANNLTDYAIPRISFRKSEMAITNIRYSYDPDNDSSTNNPYDYDFGFTMVGSQPYINTSSNVSFEYKNLKRREPKIVYRVPQQYAMTLANKYVAFQTGFSWDEYDNSNRWEGIFWAGDWHPLHNTGGPTQKWNMRREFNPNPTTERKLYYSDIDKRIHLFGAKEGMLEIGDIVPKSKYQTETEPVIRILSYDTDNNGFLDRWETDLDDDGNPEHIIQATDEKARLIPLDHKSLNTFYAGELLPNAIQDDTNFINDAKQRLGYTPQRAIKWENLAEQNISSERKKFLLDVIKELYAYEFEQK